MRRSGKSVEGGGVGCRRLGAGSRFDVENHLAVGGFFGEDVPSMAHQRKAVASRVPMIDPLMKSAKFSINTDTSG